MRDPAPTRACATLAVLAAAGLAACGDRRPSDDQAMAELADPRVIGDGPPTVWAVRCRDALTSGRAAAAKIEPALATMPLTLETRPDREQLAASAAPPLWQVPPIHVFVSRPGTGAAPPTRDWRTSAHVELGRDHRIARRTLADVEAAIVLDGWDPTRGDQVIAAFAAALAPCFPRNPR